MRAVRSLCRKNVVRRLVRIAGSRQIVRPRLEHICAFTRIVGNKRLFVDGHFGALFFAFAHRDLFKAAQSHRRLFQSARSVRRADIELDHIRAVNAVSGIRNEYAVGGEDLLSEYLELVFGTAFDPDVHDGAFDAQALEIEKDKLYELQASEINDKRLYCLRQARRRFFGEDVGGLERYGYAEDVPSITPQSLYAAWRQMVTGATVEAVVLGAPTAPVARRLQAALGAARAPLALNRPHPMPLRPTLSCAEPVAAVQGKLCLLFTMDGPLPPEQLSQMRLAVALLGGAPTSRLFVNVREKQSLCYYCSAAYSHISSCLSIDSGVDFADAARAQQAILDELAALIHGPIPQKELDDTRRYLCCALDSVGDSLYSLENWLLGEISRGTLYTPQQVIQQLADVDAEQVRAMLQKFSLSVAYSLSDGGDDDEY